MTAPPAQDARLRGEPVARAVFVGLPARYDRLAYLLSMGQDRRWRRAVVRHTADGQPGLALDVATGPAGIALAVAGATGANVVGVDLNEPMLRAGVARTRRPGRRGRVRLTAGRADELPFPDATFDAVTFSYLLRYVDDPAATIAEMARCLRPGGTLASLEFYLPPQPWWRAAWWCYTRLALPVLGALTGGAAWYRVGRFLGPSISVHYRRASPRRSHRGLACGGPDRHRGQRDEPGRGAGHVGPQGGAARGTWFVSARTEKTAFYAMGRGTGGFRDWLTLLHPPYTLWHLSYVAIGAALVPHPVLWRLGATMLAFFLAVGVGAHALDELNGRPLGTGISSLVLAITAGVSIAIAVVMGLIDGGLRLLPFVIVGAILVCGYNLELFGGLLHSDFWFGAAWGAFPVLVGAYAQHWTLPPAVLVAAVAAFFLSMGQRSLSTPARALRRRIASVSVRVTWRDGSQQELDRADLLAPLERALRYFTWATGTLAVALVVAR